MMGAVVDIPTDGGVPFVPHDAAWAIGDAGEVEGVQGTLSIGGDFEVDVRVAERATSDSIATDTNGPNGTNIVEHLVEILLVDLEEMRRAHTQQARLRLVI